MELLTVAEAAQKLRMSRAMVFNLIRAGELDVVRRKRYVRIPAASTDSWLARNTHRALKHAS